MTREEALNKAIGVLTYHQVNFCKSKEAVANMNEIIEALEKIDQESCGDCISREKALQIIRAWFDRESTPSDMKNEIEQLPSVTVHQKIGRWIKCIDDNGSSYYLCSACRCGEDFKFDWCPNCGANMSEIQTGAEGSEE